MLDVLLSRFVPPPSFGDVFELRVTLRNIDPPVWRLLHVPADVPLSLVHEALQVAFGWKNCHLHDFHVGEIRFSMPDGEDQLFSVDERAAPLGAVTRVGATLTYQYDFGDSWEHDIAVVRVRSGDDRTIRCDGGARACPPEDCGGPPGYSAMLEALANTSHQDHADMKRWAPRGFDPEKFDTLSVNKKLAALSKRLRL